LNSTDFEVDLRPDASSLRMFRNLSFNPWYALGEFVDNSITSALKNLEALKARDGGQFHLKIEIDFDSEKQLLVVRDNAAGISRHEMPRALRTSEPPSDTSIGLSMHGVGLKAAGFWFGRVIEVETFPISEEVTLKVAIDLDEIDQIDDPLRRGFTTVREIPVGNGVGTSLMVRDLWPERFPKGNTLGAIRRYLPSIYRQFLRPDSGEALGAGPGAFLTLTLMGRDLEYTPPALLTAPFWSSREGPEFGAPSLNWWDEVEFVLTSGKKVVGWVGILEKLNREAAGFFFHYRGKGIGGVVPGIDDSDDSSTSEIQRGAYKPRSIFMQEGSYQGQSFIGEFDLSDFGKTITTDQPLWSPDEEEEFLSLVLEWLKRPEKNYWAQVQNLRRRKRREVEAAADGKIADDSAEAFFSSLSKSRVDHEEWSQISAEPRPHDDEMEIERERIYSFPDDSGHLHTFRLVLLKSGSAELLEINEDRDAAEHSVRINLEHPSLDQFLPIQGQLEAFLVILMLALSVTEVFIESANHQAFRVKFNSIMDAFGGS
jgi:Histidine kinase-, DNA gyrase B-, and HSP90-like ATPase